MKLLSALLALALVSAPLAAAELATPTGPVILTVQGAITNTNSDGAATFDLAMLDGLTQRTTTTVTPWYQGEQAFSGVIVDALLDSVGAEGTMVTVTAFNDYSAEIPIEDFKTNPVILASRINGTVLSIRDKGPLFVIYPFELDQDLYNEVYFGRSVWQVKSLTVH